MTTAVIRRGVLEWQLHHEGVKGECQPESLQFFCCGGPQPLRGEAKGDSLPDAKEKCWSVAVLSSGLHTLGSIGLHISLGLVTEKKWDILTR